MIRRQMKLIVCALLLPLVASAALAKSRADCEREYKPTFGQPGKDVAWEPTTPGIAAAMLQMAKTTASDRVYDLGAGDGSIVMVAAKQFGATAFGVEYNAKLAKLAQCYIEVEGLADKAKVVEGDIFKTDFSSATVVTLFLYPELNIRLRPTLLSMRPGTRVVSHLHKMGDWKWEDEVEREGRKAYLWIIPAKAQGTWEFKEQDGGDAFTLALKQEFQELTGNQTISGKSSKLRGMIRGTDVSIDLGGQRKLSGKIDGQQIIATLSDGASTRQYVGTRK